MIQIACEFDVMNQGNEASHGNQASRWHLFDRTERPFIYLLKQSPGMLRRIRVGAAERALVAS